MSSDGSGSAQKQKKGAKYVVHTHDGEQVEDCFVITSGDLFGPATLYEYANLVQTMLETDRMFGFLKESQRNELENLAEYAVEMAQNWQRQGGQHVPE